MKRKKYEGHRRKPSNFGTIEFFPSFELSVRIYALSRIFSNRQRILIVRSVLSPSVHSQRHEDTVHTWSRESWRGACLSLRLGLPRTRYSRVLPISVIPPAAKSSPDTFVIFLSKGENNLWFVMDVHVQCTTL